MGSCQVLVLSVSLLWVAGYLKEYFPDWINGHRLKMAWILSRQQCHENLYVLDGGLNKWLKTFTEPKIPDETASTSEFDLFAFRKGVSIHFGRRVTAAVGTKLDLSRKK